MDWGSKYLVDFNTGKSQMVSFDRSNNTDAIDGKMDESVFEEKSYFKMLGLASLLNQVGAFTLSLRPKLQENWSLDSFCMVFFT